MTERTKQEKAHFRARMGADLRRLREEADISLQLVADVLGSEKRDRFSKIERGVSGIDLFDYLRLMWFYRDYDPQHPAVLLARRLLPVAAKKEVAVIPSQPGKTGKQ
jgi:transcriptional regulator with XRE-family HTH domain